MGQTSPGVCPGTERSSTHSLPPSPPRWKWNASDPPCYSKQSLLGRDGWGWQGLSAKEHYTNLKVAMFPEPSANSREGDRVVKEALS